MKKDVFIFLLIALTAYSCSKDDDPIENPEQAIIGKWKLTHLGNGAESPPYEGNTGYQEYLADSVMRIQNVGEEIINQKYWFKDSLLYEKATYLEAGTNDTVVFIIPYKYQFINRNKLRLDLQNPAIFTTAFYKRIN